MDRSLFRLRHSPNPARWSVRITASADVRQLELVDSNGRVVRRYRCDGGGMHREHQKIAHGTRNVVAHAAGGFATRNGCWCGRIGLLFGEGAHLLDKFLFATVLIAGVLPHYLAFTV